MEILEFNKELQKGINEDFKKIQELCEDVITTAQEAKSVYDRYILDEEYPRALQDNKKLLEEKLDDMHQIWRLKDEISRLQNLCIDNNIKFRE